MNEPSINNVFLTDENVYGPAVEMVQRLGVNVIRDIDLDIPCPPKMMYDVCLFQYAMAHGYILVTANIKDFEWQYYEYAAAHETPGIILIRDKFHRSATEIGTWLALWSDVDFRNRLQYLPPQ